MRKLESEIHGVRPIPLAAPKGQQVPFKSAKKETPTASPLIVLALAFGSGVIAFVALSLFVGGLRLLGADWNLGPAMIGAGVTMFGTLALLMWKEARSLMYVWEEITGHDLDGDGHTGAPPPTPQYTTYELPMAPGHKIIGELPFEDKLVIEWCAAAINGQSLSYAAWEARFALPDGTGGRDRYGEFRGFLVKQNLGREVGGNVGFKLTRKGYMFAGGFSQLTPEKGTPLLDAHRQE